MKPSTLVVVTGATGAGKTTLSVALASGLQYRVVNIGDLLDPALREADMRVVQRTDIGPRFLAAFGLSGYMAVVREAAMSGTVIDGLRLFPALPALRDEWPGLFHVHREAPPRVEQLTGGSGEPYTGDVHRLASCADWIVPWQEEIKDLDLVASELIDEIKGQPQSI